MWLVHVVSFSFALAVPNYLPFQFTPRYLTYHQRYVLSCMSRVKLVYMYIRYTQGQNEEYCIYELLQGQYAK